MVVSAMRGSRGGDALAPLAIELPAPLTVTEGREPRIVKGITIQAGTTPIRILTAYAQVLTPLETEIDMEMVLEEERERIAVFPAPEPQKPAELRFYTWSASAPLVNAAVDAVLCPIPPVLLLPPGAKATLQHSGSGSEIQYPSWTVEGG
jgi:hypothetical protein